MASATRVQITAQSLRNAFTHGKQPSEASFAMANKLLQENLENHHAIFMREEGFHSHIVHHQLAVLALGGSPDDLKTAYYHKLPVQRPIGPIDNHTLNNLRDSKKFSNELGDVDKYHELLIFYQEAIEKKGYRQVIIEELFAGGQRSNNLLGRMFAGLLHPMIHLGYGIEFEQPAIVAEALAQGALHPDWIVEHLLSAEANAASNGKPDKSLFKILEEVQSNQSLRDSVRWEDSDKIRDGIFARAPEAMHNIISEIKFHAQDLQLRTSEMINLTAYIAAAAQRPDKEIRYDFFLIHALNSSIFFSAILKQDWLSVEQKLRLLEFKARMDMIMYVSRGMPELRIQDVRSYKAKKQHESSWSALFKRINVHKDDGHSSKLVRALANGQQACAPFEERITSNHATGTSIDSESSISDHLASQFMLKNDDWLRAANMAVDSVEGIVDGQERPPRWVRNAGFEQAWESYVDHESPRPESIR